jgi:protein O-mannosyl-transferase
MHRPPEGGRYKHPMPKPGRPRQTPARLHSIVPVAVLLVAAVATYFNALGSPFVWDDDPAIVTNQSIRGSLADALVPPLETPVAGRPTVNVSLAVNYGIGALDPAGYHIGNLAVHLASALLLFAIVSRTLAARRVFRDRAYADVVALIASLIWMVHPLLSETVDYVTQRSESMMGLLFLLTLYAAIRARAEARESSQRERRRVRWDIVSIASCAVGMATKESMVTAPIAVVLYDLVFEFDSAGDALRSRAFLYGGLAATWMELGVIMWRWPRSTVGGAAVGAWTYLLNQAQMIVRYLGLVFWPQSLVVDYGLPRALALRDVIVPGTLVVALLGAAAFAFVRRPAAGFLGAMFFLTLAPTSSFVPITTEVGAERRMYLPLAALVVLFVVLAALLVERLRGRSPGRSKAVTAAALALSVAIAAALAVRTAYRNREYQSALTLWESVVERRPQGRARFALATQLMDAGRHDEAIVQLREAVADFPDARAGLGTELLIKGEFAEGVAVLEAFVEASPSAPNRAPARPLLASGYRGLAEQAMRQRQFARAAEQARLSLRYDANSAEAHNVLGAALASQGQFDQAVREFREAVRIDPRNASAANNLARAEAILRK